MRGTLRITGEALRGDAGRLRRSIDGLIWEVCTECEALRRRLRGEESELDWEMAAASSDTGAVYAGENNFPAIELRERFGLRHSERWLEDGLTLHASVFVPTVKYEMKINI